MQTSFEMVTHKPGNGHIGPSKRIKAERHYETMMCGAELLLHLGTGYTLRIDAGFEVSSEPDDLPAWWIGVVPTGDESEFRFCLIRVNKKGVFISAEDVEGGKPFTKRIRFNAVTGTGKA